MLAGAKTPLRKNGTAQENVTSNDFMKQIGKQKKKMLSYKDHTDSRSKGYGKLRSETRTVSIGIYFFMAVLVVTFALALMI